MQVLEKLALPLSPDSIRKREGPGGKRLEYLSGADVMLALNDVFTPLGWSYELSKLTTVEPAEKEAMVRGKKEIKKGWVAICTVSCVLRVHPNGIVLATKNDFGHGVSELMPTKGQATEIAEKSGATDALKRAARSLGPRFGLALYVDKEEREDLGLVGEAEEAPQPERQQPERPTGVVPVRREEPKPVEEEPAVILSRWLLRQELHPLALEALQRGEIWSANGGASLLPPEPTVAEVGGLALTADALQDLMSWPAADPLTRPLLVELYQAAVDAVGDEETRRLWSGLGVELKKSAQVSGYVARLFAAGAGAVAATKRS